MSVLVTGGLGYIGSHVVVELMKLGKEVVIIDNLSNSNLGVLSGIRSIVGALPTFYEMDVRDFECLEKLFEEENIDSVMHFAGYKSVSESEKYPLDYYENNINGLLNLLSVMDKFSVNKIIFSSSACVYGTSCDKGLEENLSMHAYNTYGKTKQVCEMILEDKSRSDTNFMSISLRYFNPIGAHPSGFIGEDPNGIPNNLMPIICKVASGDMKELTIYGDNYDTSDGTCERDYIHVVDLAKGHIKALELLDREDINIRNKIYNLGTGIPHSVKEIADTFVSVNNIQVPRHIGERRPGDLSRYFADPSLANKELEWKSELSLEDMCRDSWNFYKNKKGVEDNG